MKRLVLILVVGAVTAYVAWRQLTPTTEGLGDRIRVSGNIEVTDAEVGFKLAGLVEERSADEGESVRQGDVVARLEASDLKAELAIRTAEKRVAERALTELEAGSRPQEIAAAESAVHEAEALLAELEAGSRPQEIATAEAQVSAASAELERLAGDRSRTEALFHRRIVSAEDFDHAVKAHDAAAARVREAQERLSLIQAGPRKERVDRALAALDQARSRHELAKAGPRQEAIDHARARVELASAVVAQAEVRLAYATLFAPMSGIVLSQNVEAGEFVAPGTPVVTVGNLDHVWLRTYIDETDLGRIKVGQRVHVTTDTYPEKVYEGRITFIAAEAEFTPKNVQTEKQRVKLVYRIKVTIPNPEWELKPGMPADAEILLEQD